MNLRWGRQMLRWSKLLWDSVGAVLWELAWDWGPIAFTWSSATPSGCLTSGGHVFREPANTLNWILFRFEATPEPPLLHSPSIAFFLVSG